VLDGPVTLLLKLASASRASDCRFFLDSCG
jgi:hypothetical protein